MKTPKYWQSNSLISKLLFPFGQIYGFLTQARIKLVSPQKTSVPVICIGNITAGGTGKTPVSISIAKLLGIEMHHPYFVTRGYGGKLQNIMVNNKKHSAAEVIVARANHTKEHMGLTSWCNAPDGKIVKTDVSIAKNYLSKGEIQELNEIVTMYLDYATRQARRHIPMTMADWASKLDAFLQFNDAEVLQNKGKVTASIAKAFAESEFEQYRVIQDRLYQSDFDRLVASTEEKND